MNKKKTYVFDSRSYPYVVEVEAFTILEAKEKVKRMGHHKAYFVKIRTYAP